MGGKILASFVFGVAHVGSFDRDNHGMLVTSTIVIALCSRSNYNEFARDRDDYAGVDTTLRSVLVNDSAGIEK